MLIVEESVHVTFDESHPKDVGKGVVFHDVGVSSQDILNGTEQGINQPKAVDNEKKEDDNDEKEKGEIPAAVEDLPFTCKTSKDHPIDNILGDITKGVTTRSKISNLCYHFAFVSQVEPKNAKDALLDEH